jgi:hypothetical protein
MADKPRWEDAMGSLFDMSKYPPPVDYVAPPIQGLDIPLRARVESMGVGRPQYSADVDLGPVSVEGSYRRQNDISPAEWKAMLRYGRSF